MNVSDLWDLHPQDRDKFAQTFGYAARSTHRGPDDWSHDIDLSNRRAMAAIAARAAGLPAPKPGKRRAEVPA